MIAVDLLNQRPRGGTICWWTGTTPSNASPILNVSLPSRSAAQVCHRQARGRWTHARPHRGEAIRCLLVPNLASAMFKGQRQRASVPVAMDVGKDAIWLFRSSTNAPIASAWLSQVTATPANLAASTSMGTTMTMPLLVVRVPGLLPLTIGVGGAGPDVGSSTYRFSWRGSVQRENSPAYFVSLAEWLALVEQIGLGPVSGRQS